MVVELKALFLLRTCGIDPHHRREGCSRCLLVGVSSQRSRSYFSSCSFPTSFSSSSYRGAELWPRSRLHASLRYCMSTANKVARNIVQDFFCYFFGGHGHSRRLLLLRCCFTRRSVGSLTSNTKPATPVQLILRQSLTKKKTNHAIVSLLSFDDFCHSV